MHLDFVCQGITALSQGGQAVPAGSISEQHRASSAHTGLAHRQINKHSRGEPSLCHSLLLLCSFTRHGQKRAKFGSLITQKQVNKAQNNPSAPGSVTQGGESGSSNHAELHLPPCCLIKLAECSWHLIWPLPSASAGAGTGNSSPGGRAGTRAE